MRKTATITLAVALAAAAGFWGLTRPERVDPARFAGLSGDPEAGAMVFEAGGCASCHAAPAAVDEARLTLAGGQRFPSDFGTFIAPNISPHPTAGIGGWSAADLANAMLHGTSPEGAHYYPAFPYAAYAHATDRDIADLHAFLMTLPAVATASVGHEVGFPFNIRRGLGLWKRLFTGEGWVLAEAATPELERGRYLVEGLGHCAECHTPRNALGGLERDRWLAGGPNPSGEGRIPNITPAALDWSEEDIATYLETGFTPDYDVAGGHMALVIAAYSRLPPEDRAAVAAYLKAVPGAE